MNFSMSRIGRALGFALLGSFFLAGSLAAPPVAAAPGDGSGAGAITLDPNSGTWYTPGDPGVPLGGYPVTVTGSLECPASSGGTVGALPFIAEQGSELPVVDANTTPQSLIDSGALVAYSDTGLLGDGSTKFSSYTGEFFSTRNNWVAKSALPGVLKPNHSYSFGVLCVESVLDMTTWTGKTTVQGINGKAVTAWTALTTGADVKNWSTPAKLNPTTTKLSGTGKVGSVDLSAEVNADIAGGLADDAQGVIEFYEGAAKLGQQTVSAGKATFAVNNLEPGSTHDYTAKFVPAEPGATGPFYGGSESTVVSVRVPTTTPTTPPPTESPSPTPTPSESSETTSPSPSESEPDPGPGDTGSSAAPAPGGGAHTPGANSGFAPLTGWLGQTVSSPEGITGLFAAALVLVTGFAFGFNILTRRARKRGH
ncbi:hypothetical protein [Arthrobacter sp. NPDC090010]|uniref:hypothetical protein n=1 Tax=Arthrobacter sp. NPDC090010 TaxID=3363942 RepID=UPI003826F779